LTEENCCLSQQATDEEAIAIVRIEDNVETCNVGFIPHVQMKVPKVVWSVNKLAYFAEIYDMSENRYIGRIAKRICVMSGLHLVDNILISE
jgi:hypothetical protein